MTSIPGAHMPGGRPGARPMQTSSCRQRPASPCAPSGSRPPAHPSRQVRRLRGSTPLRAHRPPQYQYIARLPTPGYLALLTEHPSALWQPTPGTGACLFVCLFDLFTLYFLLTVNAVGKGRTPGTRGGAQLLARGSRHRSRLGPSRSGSPPHLKTKPRNLKSGRPKTQLTFENLLKVVLLVERGADVEGSGCSSFVPRTFSRKCTHRRQYVQSGCPSAPPCSASVYRCVFHGVLEMYHIECSWAGRVGEKGHGGHCVGWMCAVHGWCSHIWGGERVQEVLSGALVVPLRFVV